MRGDVRGQSWAQNQHQPPCRGRPLASRATTRGRSGYQCIGRRRLAPQGSGGPCHVFVGVDFALARRPQPVSEVRAATTVTGGGEAKIGSGPQTARPCTPPPGRQLDENDRPTARPMFDLHALAQQAIAQDPPERPSDRSRDRARPTERAPQGPTSASALLGAIADSTGPRKTEPATEDAITEMKECFSSADYAAALAIADRTLATQPDHPLARALRADCRAALEDVYAFRLAPMDRVPVVTRLPAHGDSPFADHRTGFLLSIVKGSATLEAIVDACGMPKPDALCILDDLVQRGVIGFE
jgi:hypothetical protein